jgi:FkbM family methyltransferase
MKNKDLIKYSRKLKRGIFHNLGLTKKTKWDFVSYYSKNESGVAEIDGEKYHFNDVGTFKYAFVEIFEKGVYDFPSTSPSPKIIDCGANIGIATRFWAKKYPQSRIIAFEPDPQIFQFLKKNTQENQTANFELHQSAVWIENKSLKFVASGLESGHLGTVPSTLYGATIEIPGQRLKDFLNETVDFLKIDIEGAERDVIKDCAEKLNNVKCIYIEYHQFKKELNALHEILSILSATAFEYIVMNDDSHKRPLFGISERFGALQKYHIYAWNKKM